MKASGVLKEYNIVGRRYPSEKEPKPTLYRMRIFAPEDVSAKSRYWYFMSKLRKLKKANGEIVSITEVRQRSPTKIKNVGIWLRYDSRSGTHNMYREYRDLTITGAVTQCYRDMGAKHRARTSSIHILRVEVIPTSKCRRPQVKQFHTTKIKFPLPHRVVKSNFQKKFSAVRPSTTF
ncbi:hypothetical protein EMCRGX_G002922 [Ephydatia muelleri]